MKRYISILQGLWVLIIILNTSDLNAWGFFAHKKINQIAIYGLPYEMIGFYKANMHEIIEKSVQPDKRRYIDPSEGVRHYIDLDHYGDSAIYIMPHQWHEAVEKFSEDTLKEYGIVPWHILLLKKHLTKAFEERDLERILRISSDLGHYIADANVPLHTTENYNGQLTDQKGIHGLWESRLTELYFEDFNLLTGKAKYLENVNEAVWKNIIEAHLAVDSVLKFEIEATEKIGEEKKYSYETRGKGQVRVYSRKFCNEYYQMLDGMVERQMKKAIHLVSSIWFTAWVDAGQPELENSEFHEGINDTVEVVKINPQREHQY